MLVKCWLVMAANRHVWLALTQREIHGTPQEMLGIYVRSLRLLHNHMEVNKGGLIHNSCFPFCKPPFCLSAIHINLFPMVDSHVLRPLHDSIPFNKEHG